jgi:hypothetical protein
MTDPRFVDRPLDPSLSEQQRLTLVRLMEECAEVQKAAAKIITLTMRISATSKC